MTTWRFRRTYGYGRRAGTGGERITEENPVIVGALRGTTRLYGTAEFPLNVFVVGIMVVNLAMIGRTTIFAQVVDGRVMKLNAKYLSSLKRKQLGSKDEVRGHTLGSGKVSHSYSPD
jgi:hypothetical protein